jgi:hypothetical protein
LSATPAQKAASEKWGKSNPNPPVVFLDLDKTLIECNSGWRWILAELRTRRVSPVRPSHHPQR